MHPTAFLFVRLSAALLVAGACASCSAKPPTQPTPPISLTGTWRGSITVSGVPSLMTWTLTQTNASVSGPVLVTLPTGVVLMNGSLSGTLSSSTLTYTIAVPAGGIPPQPACSGQLGGTTTVVSASSMTGSYTVTSSTCATGLTAGSFALTKD
jgi:hypothetical protein